METLAWKISDWVLILVGFVKVALRLVGLRIFKIWYNELNSYCIRHDGELARET